MRQQGEALALLFGLEVFPYFFLPHDMSLFVLWPFASACACACAFALQLSFLRCVFGKGSLSVLRLCFSVSIN